MHWSAVQDGSTVITSVVMISLTSVSLEVLPSRITLRA